jgi:site-specific DNA recombinase
MIERSRRGKRHAARRGSLSVRPKAPYGYRYLSKAESGGQPRYEVVPEEARVVQQVFSWVGRERWTLGAVVRQLQRDGVRTATGKPTWTRAALGNMLNNPTYIGRAAYGCRRSGPWRPPLRPYRNRGTFPRHPTTPTPVPQSEWLSIPVPAIIGEATFAVVQEHLAENRKRVREHLGPAGSKRLLVCARCGYSYYYRYCRETRRRAVHEYHYYRCRGTDACQYGGVKRCNNRPVSAEAVEAAVWAQVCTLLAQPDRLAVEYQRRLRAPQERPDREAATLRAARARAQQGIARLIDSYADGLITKEEFTPRVERLRRRMALLDEQLAQQRSDDECVADLHRAVGRLEDFARLVRTGLQEADQAAKREILLAVVKRIEVDVDAIRIVFNVTPHAAGPPTGHILRDCLYGAGGLAPVAAVSAGRATRPGRGGRLRCAWLVPPRDIGASTKRSTNAPCRLGRATKS